MNAPSDHVHTKVNKCSCPNVEFEGATFEDIIENKASLCLAPMHDMKGNMDCTKAKLNERNEKTDYIGESN